MSIAEITLPPTLPDAHTLITSLHQQLQQSRWRIQQLEKELYGSSSERQVNETLSKEQILLSLFPAPARPAATQQVLLPTTEQKSQPRPRREPAAKVLETVTERIEPQ